MFKKTILSLSLCLATSMAFADTTKYVVWYSVSQATNQHKSLNISKAFSIPHDIQENTLKDMYDNFLTLQESQDKMFANYVSHTYTERHVALFDTQQDAQQFEKQTIDRYRKNGVTHIDEHVIHENQQDQMKLVDYMFNPVDVQAYYRKEALENWKMVQK